MKRFVSLFLLLMIGGLAPATAHVGNHPSIHDTVAGVLSRMRAEVPADTLVGLTARQARDLLTDEEKHILGTQYLTFTVDVPVYVYVMYDADLGDEAFWLPENGFYKTALNVVADNEPFIVWKREFKPGNVGLGVNSLSGNGDHYFVAVVPRNAADEVNITDVYPGYHDLGRIEAGVEVYCDDDDALNEVPDLLRGAILLRGADDREEEAQLINVFRKTPYPSSPEPDHIVLTWSDDPKTTQTIQWRTNTETAAGYVFYQTKASHNSFNPSLPHRAEAETTLLESPYVVNDLVNHRHTAVLRDLEPGTTYVYSVGDSPENPQTELAEFTTAPEGVEPFSFIYMGDAQNGLERWGSLVHNAYRHRPDAAFYVMAGDLVNRGAERDDWDTFFENAEGIYDRRQLVPAIGNHECQGDGPELYLKMFDLPKNGPGNTTPERAYTMEYSNAIFIVLDTNLRASSQTDWLESQLAATDAVWKFVVYHHPAYSSAPSRNNEDVRELWGALFDKYHVDLALQGHDHAYLRTYPMKDGKPVESPAEGTIYIVSVSGTKMYDQGDFDYTEFGMTNVSTYQTLDIQISGDRMVYKAYDIDGDLRDEFVIEK